MNIKHCHGVQQLELAHGLELEGFLFILNPVGHFCIHDFIFGLFLPDFVE